MELRLKYILGHIQCEHITLWILLSMHSQLLSGYYSYNRAFFEPNSPNQYIATFTCRSINGMMGCHVPMIELPCMWLNASVHSTKHLSCSSPEVATTNICCYSSTPFVPKPSSAINRVESSSLILCTSLIGSIWGAIEITQGSLIYCQCFKLALFLHNISWHITLPY